MIGSKNRMPKRARYPLFLAGLAVVLIGGMAANAQGYPASALAVVAVSGFLLMFLSVAIK